MSGAEEPQQIESSPNRESEKIESPPTPPPSDAPEGQQENVSSLNDNDDEVKPAQEEKRETNEEEASPPLVSVLPLQSLGSTITGYLFRAASTFTEEKETPVAEGTQETPAAGATQQETPAAEGTQQETPAAEGTQQETPAAEGTQQETPAAEATQQETPATEATQQETPAAGATQQETPAGKGVEESEASLSSSALRDNKDLGRKSEEQEERHISLEITAELDPTSPKGLKESIQIEIDTTPAGKEGEEEEAVDSNLVVVETISAKGTLPEECIARLFSSRQGSRRIPEVVTAFGRLDDTEDYVSITSRATLGEKKRGGEGEEEEEREDIHKGQLHGDRTGHRRHQRPAMLQERSVLEDILLQRTPRGILKRTRCQTVEEALEPWRHVEQRGPCGGLEGCASTETAVVVLPPQVEVPAIPFRYSGDDCKLIGLRVRRFPLSELPLEEELNIIQDQKVGCGGVACTAYQSNKSAPTRASAFCNWAAETGCGRTQIHEYPYVVDSPPSPTSTRAERWLLVDTVESSDLGGGGTVISDTQSERSLLLPALAHVSGGDRDNSQQKVYSFTPALDTVNEERRRPVPSLSGGFRAITLAREGSARHPQTPSKPWDPVDQGQPESVIA